MLLSRLFTLSIPFLLSCASAQQASELVIFNEKKALEISVDNNEARPAVDYLKKQINILSDGRISCKELNSNSKAILQFNKSEKFISAQFKVAVENETLIFEANTSEGFYSAVNHFLIHLLGFTPYTEIPSSYRIKEKSIPENYVFDSRQFSIEYKEPYFIENYRVDFAKIHGTNNLENEWMIWGHNIPKVIKIRPEMLAEVNGETYEDQLCFSSPELKDALQRMIQNSISSGENKKKVMIAPLDDVHACTCSRCEALGNSKYNASPAVFKLINDLAQKFNELEFFGTAYHSTKVIPDFSLQNNVGVLFTTMSFDKGVRYETSRNAERWKSEIASWKKLTNTVYVWDYLIHFDNYLSSYPILKLSQENIKWLHTLGVNGFFMHGTDVSYAAFSDVKAFVCAAALNNPNSDFDQLAASYFENFYPQTAELLTKYYLSIENRSFNSTKVLDIYGAWQADLMKYLEYAELDELLKGLTIKYPNLGSEEKRLINPLLCALYFQKIEIQRVTGIGGHGFLVKNDAEWKVRESLISDFKSFKKFAILSDLSKLNESGLTVNAYCDIFEERILNSDHNSEILGRTPIFIQKPDDDYAKSSMLSDGARGFNEYYNNWLLNYTSETHVKINFPKALEGKYYINLGLLQSKRHRIKLPERVTVFVGGKKQVFVVGSQTEDGIIDFTQEIEFHGETEIEIILNKTAEGRNLATGCDEIKIVKSKTM